MTAAQLLKANPLPEGLNPYGLMALEHWVQHLPQRVRYLEEQHRLLEEILEAQSRTEQEMSLEMERLIQEGDAPTVAHQRAWEAIRTKHLFVPGEAD